MYRIPKGVRLGAWIRSLFENEGNARKFYLSREWRELRAQVLADAHWECADCKAKVPARYSLATCVHHDQHVRKKPDLALSRTWTDKEGAEHVQLVPLCDSCHDARHDRGSHSPSRRDRPLTKEMW